MPTSPFSAPPAGFSFRNAWWLGAVAAAGYLPNMPIREVLKAAPYHAVDVSWVVKQGDFGATVAFVDAGETMYVGVEGTSNLVQGLSYIFRDGFVYPYSDARGVFRPFHEIGFGNALDVKARVPKSKPIVLTGHSLGGASAAVAAEILKRDGWNVKALYSFGQPFTGNVPWGQAYDVPTHRVFQHADIVPKVPFVGAATDFAPREVLFQLLSGNWWGDRVMTHIGLPIELDQPGYGDDVEFYMKGLRGLGLKNLFDFSAHFMGNYLGLLYQRLDDDDKFFFLNAAQELSKTQSFALFDAAFPSRDPSVNPAAAAVVAQEERAFAQSLLGPQSKASVRLFQGAYVKPAAGQVPNLVQATFPGYAPLKPPADARISGGAPDVVKLGPASMTWECTADLSPPQLIGGAHVTYVHDDGQERLVGVYPMPDVLRVERAGQQVTLDISANLAKFSD